MIFNIPFDKIDESLLNSLVGTTEDRQIEFKGGLPGKDHDSVKEFLKDVSGMANTNGGDIIFGIREGNNSDGDTAAVSIDGLPSIDIDEEKRRLETLIQTSIKPRLIGYTMSPIVISENRKVMIIRVPVSWNSPHVVDYQKHWRFYYRDSAGTHPMDVTALRHAFLSRDAVKQRLEDFRYARLARIAADPTLGKTAKIVIHSQPLESTSEDFRLDLSELRQRGNFLAQLGFGSSHEPQTRPNFDGLFVYDKGVPSAGYIQVFRNAVIEEVDASVLPQTVPEKPDLNYIPSRTFEDKMIKGASRRLALLKALGIASQVILQVSLLGVAGYRMGIQYRGLDLEIDDIRSKADQFPIDRQELIIPGVLIDDFHSFEVTFGNCSLLLRPVFDAVWNAAGFIKSPNYDSDGNWKGNLEGYSDFY